MWAELGKSETYFPGSLRKPLWDYNIFETLATCRFENDCQISVQILSSIFFKTKNGMPLMKRHYSSYQNIQRSSYKQNSNLFLISIDKLGKTLLK